MITYSIIQKSQLEGARRIDAEYYQPEYLDWLKDLNHFELFTLDKLTKKIDVGFVSSMISHFVESGIPLLRTQNVKEFYIDLDSDLVYIDEEFHNKLKKSRIFPGQVLLARSGTIGDACVVPNNFPIANSADIILIQPKNDLLPEYLTAYLNSKYGRFQIDRGSSGGLQGHINLFSLEKVLVPRLKKEFQEEISNKVFEGIKELSISKSLYSRAENMLLEGLGLDDFKFKEDLFFIVNSSKAKDRFDADYFQPKYERLISTLNKYETKTLGELVTMKNGIEPGSEAYEEEGKLFIRVSSLSKYGIDNNDQKYLKDDLYQKLKKDFQPQMGEILLTKDASPGVAYVVKEPVEGIISGGILKLVIKDKIEPEYLTLCINSVIGQMQAERDAGGSVIEHWKPDEIKKLIIPILPISFQQKIAELVRKSHEARKKSKELLEEAKRKVEEIIEKRN